MYTVAFTLTRSTSVAEEIVEDVFLKIWLRRSQLDEIENFSAYLYTRTIVMILYQYYKLKN